MRLGFAVKTLGEGGLPSHDARKWQSGPHLRWSIEALHRVFDHLERADIDMYRMTASLAPYATHPEIGPRPEFAGQLEDCREELAELGARATARGLRLSTHPGQYVVLNSESEEVRAAAIRDVELQAEILDAMGQGPEAVVVLHVGGAAGGFEAAMARFEAGAELLSDRARDRLVIENDDRTFGLCHVMELHRRTRLKVVSGHPAPPLQRPRRDRRPRGARARSVDVAAGRAAEDPLLDAQDRHGGAAQEGRPRVERSWVLPQLGAHADVIDPIGFEHFLRETAAGLEFDVMLEAKAKDLALLRLREQLLGRGVDLRPGSTARRPLPAAA